ncbi:MAG TPA: hypothetical protein VF466_01950 [Candidatus Saccharimonadales bacterium]
MSKRIVRADDANKIAEHGVSLFSEYDLPFSTFAVGVSEINGRYPQAGFDVDDDVEQVWYVVEGSARITLGEDQTEIGTGDMLLVARGTPYIIDGTVKLVVASGPPWHAEQHRHIETL